MAQKAGESSKISAMETLIEVYNTLETEKLDAIMTSGFIRRAPDVNANNLDEYKSFLHHIRINFSKFEMVVDAAAVNGNDGFIRWTARGQFVGKGATLPNGNTVVVTGAAHYEFENGKLSCEEVFVDPSVFFNATQSASPEALNIVMRKKQGI